MASGCPFGGGSPLSAAALGPRPLQEVRGKGGNGRQPGDMRGAARAPHSAGVVGSGRRGASSPFVRKASIVGRPQSESNIDGLMPTDHLVPERLQTNRDSTAAAAAGGKLPTGRARVRLLYEQYVHLPLLRQVSGHAAQHATRIGGPLQSFPFPCRALTRRTGPAALQVWESPSTEKPVLEPLFAAGFHGIELAFLLLAEFVRDSRRWAGWPCCCRRAASRGLCCLGSQPACHASACPWACMRYT